LPGCQPYLFTFFLLYWVSTILSTTAEYYSVLVKHFTQFIYSSRRHSSWNGWDNYRLKPHKTVQYLYNVTKTSQKIHLQFACIHSHCKVPSRCQGSQLIDGPMIWRDDPQPKATNNIDYDLT